MSRIRGKNTEPERIVRSALHRAGFRFRLHVKDLPGKPDIVLPKYRTVIFVHGCFWHRHPGCRYAYTPKTRVPFWKRKFAENVRNDRLARRRLARLGWCTIVVRECSLYRGESATEVLLSLFFSLISGPPAGPCQPANHS